MIECYLRACPFHCKDEPFCTKDKCCATQEDQKAYKQVNVDAMRRGDDER